MRRHLGSVGLGLAMIVLLCAMGRFALAGLYDFSPPGSHTVEETMDGSAVWHKLGHTDPFVVDPVDGTSCATCHGAALEGDSGPSCYTCHGDYWTLDVTDYPPAGTGWLMLSDPDHLAYQANAYQIHPDSHTVEVSDMMVQSYAPAKAYWACWLCHAGSWGTGPAFKTTVYHGPGYGTPVESGCTQCHGANLDGVGGFAIACTFCHQKQWSGIGGGLPMDHFNWDFEGFWDVGSELKGGPTEAEGGVWHRYGWADPFSVYPQHAYGGDGCTRCHGSDLAGPVGPDINGSVVAGNGFAPSCYSCHGPNGIGPPTDHDQPKGSVPNYHKQGYMDPFGSGGCTNCHGVDLTGDGIAPSCFSCHTSLGAGHDQDLGGVNHKQGYEDPFGAGGCTECHGETLTEGPAKSCFTCHGPRWEPHNFVGEPWLPPGENQCYVCHLPPAFGAGVDSTPVWNHELSTVPGYTGTSVKCMGCHEGAPGPAVDDYAGNTTGTYFVGGEEAFGADLALHHPVSFVFDSPLAAAHGGLYDPATAPSGLTTSGTIEEDMLESGELQCTACHDQHDNSKGNYLAETARGGLCFKCHLPVNSDPTQHHIPGRDDPWGEARGTTFNCTMCHGANLEGTEEAPACTECHTPFAFPDPPLPGHHGGDRTLPYFDCAMCHADPVTGVVTGNNFGTDWAPSCYQCHEDPWNNGNQPPQNVTMPDLSGTEGKTITFDASHIIDPEADPLAMEWNFGDVSSLQLPSFESTTTHTYVDFGSYTATLAVTDGVHSPQFVQFQVIVGPVTADPVADTWTVEVSDATPAVVDTFGMTFENHTGSLVGVKDDGSLSFGVEFVGVIFWMDIWMDLSGNVFWGTGDMYFGNLDRAAGTMTGVVFDKEGGVHTFSGVTP